MEGEFGVTETFKFGVTVTVTASVAEQLFASVTVTVYVEVADGVANGLYIVVLLNPPAGDHKYDTPPVA